MEEQCTYCNLDTGGRHEIHCPLHVRNKALEGCNCGECVAKRRLRNEQDLLLLDAAHDS